MVTFDGDFPLSFAGSVAGLLTFLFALLASVYIRAREIREAKRELRAFGGTLARLAILSKLPHERMALMRARHVDE